MTDVATMSVCLLLDAAADRAVRRLWRRLEAAGVPTLLSHTHGRHVPHLTLASVQHDRLQDLTTALAALPPSDPEPTRFDALGLFPRSRSWLAVPATDGLLARQSRVVDAVSATGAVVHRHYRPGQWLPHLTLAPRLRLDQVSDLARQAFEVLPLAATLERAVVVETRTGAVSPLPHLV